MIKLRPNTSQPVQQAVATIFAAPRRNETIATQTNKWNEMKRSKQIELFWLGQLSTTLLLLRWKILPTQYLLIRFHIFFGAERLRAQNVGLFHFSIGSIYLDRNFCLCEIVSARTRSMYSHCISITFSSCYCCCSIFSAEKRTEKVFWLRLMLRCCFLVVYSVRDFGCFQMSGE